ncbi:MAG: hypothetical protein JWO22_2755 [Frankiales bacterium]|nr:hypothetical protein [Frankiales bacterium]
MTRLSDDLREALDHGRPDLLTVTDPDDARDRALTLQQLYDLQLAPLDRLGHRVVLAGDPTLAALKQRLEVAWIHELDTAVAPQVVDAPDPDTAHEALLDIAITDRLPAVYTWLARSATWEDLVRFLAVEGGPDAGFDDLVALCQVGLSGSAKLELARNYWDEMGNGEPSRVHTVLHDDLVAASGICRVPEDEMPTEALERAALNGLLATNRYLQPELVGALGMTELQAGPRCRRVVQALERLGAPEDCFPFYREHAEVDPRHGHDWVENAVKPLVATHPEWGRRIVRGAAWRAETNRRFFEIAAPTSLALAG